MSYNLLAQKYINGQVIDQDAKPIAGVNVTYSLINQKTILAFTRTAEDGTFKLNLKPTEADSITLILNHMSYGKVSENIRISTDLQTFIMEAHNKELDAIVVKQKAILQDQDTLTFNVNAFSSQQDRVIADIIKKLPGVEMQGDRILYQGKPIQKYMVNNLDLMEGRYGIINNNLPIDAVRNVQIIENNQPIKILDSLVFSDKASLNIELKKFTTTGSGKFGIGASPALWNANITPMTFNKSFQMINSFQSNNIGLNVANQLSSLSSGTSISPAPSYLNVRNTTTPGFDERRWLDNKIFLGSSNFLKKLNNGLELKGNISYYDDTQNKKGVTNTQYFTSQEIIQNREEISNTNQINALNLGLLVEQNEKSIYLKNTFLMNKRWNVDFGKVILNTNTPISQKRNYEDLVLLNHLSAKRIIGKQLIDISSKMEYHDAPQRLWITPGQFEAIFNQNSKEMEQMVFFKSFSWKNELSFIRKIKDWRLIPKMGINYQNNYLDSYITIDKSVLEDSLFRNNTKNSVIETFISTGINLEKTKWKLNSNFPISLNAYYFTKNEIRTTFNPNINLTWLINSSHNLTFNLNGGNRIGDLNNFYNGYIINQYRNMQRYEMRLLETQSLNPSLSYAFKNITKATFANFAYNYSLSRRDFIFNTNIDSLGRNNTQIADQNSQTASHRINGGITKIFMDIKTNVKVHTQLNWANADYLLNNKWDQQHNFNNSISLELINNYFNTFSVEYKTTLGQSHTKLGNNLSNQLKFGSQFLNFHIYPNKKQTFILYNSYYTNNIASQRNQYFMDATYRYSIKKWKTDLELTANNLLNNKNYVQQFATTYELIQSSFQLRPRQFFISTNFRF